MTNGTTNPSIQSPSPKGSTDHSHTQSGTHHKQGVPDSAHLGGEAPPDGEPPPDGGTGNSSQVQKGAMLLHDAVRDMNDDAAEEQILVELLRSIPEPSINFRVSKPVLKAGLNHQHEENITTALHVAVDRQLTRATRQLLQAGASVSLSDDAERQPLHLACVNGNTDIFQQLVANGASITAVDASGLSPLGLACIHGSSEIVSLIISTADMAYKQGEWTLLHMAAYFEHPKIVKMLLDKKADCLIADFDGWTPLMTATIKANEEIMNDIINHTPDPKAIGINETNNEFKTPLMVASANRFATGVEMLIKKGADVNIKDSQGKNALHHWLEASKEASEPITKISTDPEQPDAIVDLFLAHGANLGLVTNENDTALHIAVRQRKTAAAQLLIQKMDRGQLFACNKYDETALSIAFDSGDESDSMKRVKGDLISKKDPQNWRSDILLLARHRDQHHRAKIYFENSPMWKNVDPELSTEKWSGIQWAAFMNMPDALWWFLATSNPSIDVKSSVSEALKIVKAERQKETFTSIQQVKGTSKEAEKPRLINEILKNPPYGQIYTYADTVQAPKCDPRKEFKDLLRNFKANAVLLHEGRNGIRSILEQQSLHELIYDNGPKAMVKEQNKVHDEISDLISQNNEDLSKEMKDINNRFTWINLPATNMTWMNDLLQRILKDDEYDARRVHEIRSFFKNSWIQIPDGKSDSRFMKPRHIEAKLGTGSVKQKETSQMSGGRSQEPGELPQQSENKPLKTRGISEIIESIPQNQPAICDNHPSMTQESSPIVASKLGKRAGKNKESSQRQNALAVSATYMPYLHYSTNFEAQSLNNAKKETHGATTQENYQKLMNLCRETGDIIHGSSTLDESYYHFSSDSGPSKERERRNKSQVVTKYMKTLLKGEKKSVANDDCCPLIRNNQLWMWNVNQKWLITSTSCPVDGNDEDLTSKISNYLQREADAGNTEIQPSSATEMGKVIVDYCIGTYDRKRLDNAQSEKPNSQPDGLNVGQLSVRQIFSNYLNHLGMKEAEIFEKFCNDINGTSNDMSRETVIQELRASIKSAAEHSGNIKDVRDELDMLKAIAGFQHQVQKKMFPGRNGSELSAYYILNDLRELDKIAARTQSAITTTLTLLESEIANIQAEETMQQGRQMMEQGRRMMVFTYVTVIFLPPSFFAALFALDVASFLDAPYWAHLVLGLLAVAAMCIVYILHFFPSTQVAPVSGKEVGIQSEKEVTIKSQSTLSGTKVGSQSEPVASGIKIKSLGARLRRRLPNDEEMGAQQKGS